MKILRHVIYIMYYFLNMVSHLNLHAINDYFHMDVSMWGIITVFPDSRCITPQGKLSTSIKYNYNITYIVKAYICMSLYLYLVVILTILTCQYTGAYCMWCMGVNKFKRFSHSPVYQYPTTPTNQLSFGVHFILTPPFLEQRTCGTDNAKSNPEAVQSTSSFQTTNGLTD